MTRRFLPVAAALLLLTSSACKRAETRVTAGDRTQTLHLGNLSEPSDLDPQLITSITDAQVSIGLMEGLTAMDPKDAHPVPGVAESWEVSADNLTWTFHLRANARWSNGDPVTARDFAYSIQRILSPNLASEYASILYSLRGAEAYNTGKLTDFSQVGVRVIDDHTLALTLHTPVAYLPSLVMHQSWHPVHKATIEKFGRMDERGTRWTRPGNFVGNGPFTLDAWEPNQVLRLVKSETYWDRDAVRLKAVNFYPIEDRATEEASFRAGQLHVTATIPPDKIATYKRDQPQLLRQEATFASYFLTYNTTKAPLNDVRVRRALALVIDRAALCEKVLLGGRTPAYTFTPPGIAGYEATPGFKEDIAEAKRLLADAGFPDGKGFPRLELLTAKGGSSQMPEAMQQMWKTHLGIDIAIVLQEGRVFFDSLRTHSFDIAPAGWVGDYLDPTSFLDVFRTGGGNNHTGWSSAAYDRLLAEALKAGDNAVRYPLYHQAEQLLINDMPIAPLVYGRRNYLASPSVRGWEPNVLDLHPLKGVYLVP
ncbi:peptide ABC transporter substrate-binding protein [Rariglobus hedericola]|uniref:Peptide ABC transporter substrate-binding protein n=1 Tax=Rariglobus hedericola TaxID=2597822 RepID=A0A556QKE1_9BACT|nr:peptide ABC transporter substrate-binding protein [Rariglobus hedericola]TSJ77098.1 peptide ABC transporter substrate-binding protein [Rariglobus hedericola]